MMNSMGKIGTVLVVAVIVLSGVAMAAPPISTIVQGNTVFLGEEGLDITRALNGAYFGEACGVYVDNANLTATPHLTRIGWWASAANIYNTAPSRTIDLGSRYTSMLIAPSEFAGYTGNWYLLGPNDMAYSSDVPGCGCTASGCTASQVFTVQDPNLDIRVYDATVDVDATANGWITSGDEVEFRVTTNLYQITERPGVPFVPIAIHVQSPDGAEFSALTNSAGTSTSITDVPLTTSPYSTGPIWDTGRHDLYPYGTYQIWAECNVNSMKDNYPVSGKTYTPGEGLLDQERNPLITVTTLTASPTTVVTTPPATLPATVPTTAQITVTTPVQTMVTTPPVVLTTPATVPTTAPTATTRSPGFESILAGAARLLACAWFARRG